MGPPFFNGAKPMSGKVNKRLRRAARKRAGNDDGTIVKYNQTTGESAMVDLYSAYKKIHGRIPWNKRKTALDGLGK